MGNMPNNVPKLLVIPPAFHKRRSKLLMLRVRFVVQVHPMRRHTVRQVHPTLKHTVHQAQARWMRTVHSVLPMPLTHLSTLKILPVMKTVY